MSSRRLQSEIDRVLKKVAEGVDEFQATYDKLLQCSNANQKEKVEQELKKEIKKLQRHRDQIKTWIAGNEVKDKTALLENRQLIETQMEKFKHCEKDVKIKPYSKEGLNMREKVDPKEVDRRGLIEWIAGKIAQLNLQIEKQEAEMEQMQSMTRKGRKDPAKSESYIAIEQSIEHERWHVGRLELINRLLENCVVSNEKSDNFIAAVMDIKDDIDYYVLNNLDGSHDAYEDMYASLNLEEEEELYHIGEMEHHDSHESVTDDPPNSQKEPTSQENAPTKEIDTVPPSSAKWNGNDHTEALSPTKTKTSGVRKQIDKKAKDDVKPVKPVDSKPRPPNLAVSGRVPPQPPHPLPQRYAAAAAAGPTVAEVVAAQHQPHNPPAAQKANPPMSAVRTHADVAKPHAPTSTARTSSHIPNADHHVQAPVSTVPIKTAQGHATTLPEESSLPQSVTPSSRHYNAKAAGENSPTQKSMNVQSVSSLVQQSSSASPSSSTTVPQQVLPQPAQQTAEVPPPVPKSPVRVASNHSNSPSRSSPVHRENPVSPAYAECDSTENVSSTDFSGLAYTRGLADLLPSLEAAKMKLIGTKNEENAILYAQIMVETSYQYAPDYMDMERNRPYITRQPFPSPLYYPQNVSPSIYRPETYEKIDSDCLFFIFYYMAGTYHQYLAARELKRQSWRFHTKYVTWFQRHEEPDSITDDYEQGSYIYFDYEGMWCQRKKTDFRFEYQYLEDTAEV